MYVFKIKILISELQNPSKSLALYSSCEVSPGYYPQKPYSTREIGDRSYAVDQFPTPDGM